jgi:hypothetical protein
MPILFTGSLAIAPGLIFVNPTHPFEQFLGVGFADFLAFRSVVITITITRTDWLCVSLLAFKLRNEIGCHFSLLFSSYQLPVVGYTRGS